VKHVRVVEPLENFEQPAVTAEAVDPMPSPPRMGKGGWCRARTIGLPHPERSRTRASIAAAVVSESSRPHVRSVDDTPRRSDK
jgi:hypothetical protein